MNNGLTIYGNRGNFIRLLYLNIAILYWICTGFGLCFRNKIIVLCYHGIKDYQSSQFYLQMNQIASRVMRIPSSVACRSKKFRLPFICITFDDALENLLRNAIPVLENYKIPAVIFAVSENMGETPRWKMPIDHPDTVERLMTAEQLKITGKNPLISIGSHTMTHQALIHIPLNDVKTELIKSKQKLEMLLNCSIEDFALPYGLFNQGILDAAHEAGYQRVYTLETKPIDSNEIGNVIGRFSMSPDVWNLEFILTCAGAYSWLYKFRKMIYLIKAMLYRKF